MPAKDLFLKETKTFTKLIKEGRKCFSPHFILYILERTDIKSKARLGILSKPFLTLSERIFFLLNEAVIFSR